MATKTEESSTSNVLCKYFISGVCRKGEDCCFSHNRSDRPDNVCKYYLKGNCSYGDGCKFDHIKPQRNTYLSVSSRKSNIVASTSEKMKYLNEERPAKLVSLSKTKSSFNKDQPKSWVDAPDFVPGRKSHTVMSKSDSDTTNATVQDNVTYSEVTRTGVEHILDGMSEEEASLMLCPFAAMGHCEMGDNCPYFHGLQCDICDNYCLDPNDPLQQKEHKEECMKLIEENMNYSFAIQKSDEVSCGICLDKIRLNPDTKDKRFGILPECNHPFCLTCIRKWRSSSTSKDKFVRACPLCRVPSGYVIPSEFWVDDSTEKSKLISKYREAMSSKPCKYFDCGKGTCPFGASCFYKHATPDGTLVKVKVRRYDDSEGESRIINPPNLWEFIEARDTIDLDELLEHFL